MARTSFFCGIGGSGMSALAAYLRHEGESIAGSDRNHDKNLFPELFGRLKGLGIELFPQDGSGITKDVRRLVVSSAVEASIPDVKAALDQNIPVVKRAEVLAEISNTRKSVCVGGTSGKSTVTGMIAHCLREAGYDPAAINGAVMLGADDTKSLGNVMFGKGAHFVCETDESDGSIALFRPAVSVLTNISEDHKSMDVLRGLFGGFVAAGSLGAVLNADDPESVALNARNRRIVTFGLSKGADIHGSDLRYAPESNGATFSIGGKIETTLQVPGRHNVANALAAIAACQILDVSIEKTAQALKSFRGIKSRLEIVGIKNGITVIDDFAHNPDKIAASLQALKEKPGRLLVFYQPHGFTPTRQQWDGLVAAFSKGMGRDDILMMPEIFYAGGSVDQSISARDLIKAIGGNSVFTETKKAAHASIMEAAQSGDRIVIMGARDDGLRAMARDIAAQIYHRTA